MSSERKNTSVWQSEWVKEWEHDRGRQKAGQEEGEKQRTAALPSSGVQIWQAFRFSFFFFSKKNPWKALFQARTERGIRQRRSEWKKQTFLYTSCAFTCQSAAIKLLPHGQCANILNSKDLKACLWKFLTPECLCVFVKGNNCRL